MRKISNPKYLLIGLIMGLFILVSSPAYSHYLVLDEAGLLTAEIGDTVTISVYLHTESEDSLYGWGLNLGFDDVELTYVEDSMAYGISYGTDESEGYTLNGSTDIGGASLFHAGCYDWSFEGFTMDADTDYLLFSVSFTFNGGTWDGDDIWVEWGHDDTSYFDLDGGWTDGLTVNSGEPDYSNVPVPAGIWLMFSGLIGICGLRRYNK